jgi:hypothetical protein
MVGLLSLSIATPRRHAIFFYVKLAGVGDLWRLLLLEVLNQHQVAAGLIKLRIWNPVAVGRNS